MLDGNQLIELDDSLRIKVLESIDENLLIRVIDKKDLNACEMINELNCEILGVNWSTIEGVINLIEDSIRKERRRIEDLKNALANSNREKIRENILKLKEKLNFRDYETFEAIFDIKCDNKNLILIDSILKEATSNNDLIDKQDFNEIYDEEFSIDIDFINLKKVKKAIDSANSRADLVKKRLDEKIVENDKLKKENDGKNEALSNLIDENRELKDIIGRDRELVRQIKFKENELDNLRSRAVILEDTLSEKRNVLTNVELKYNNLLDKKKKMDLLLEDYILNAENKFLEMNLDNSLAKIFMVNNKSKKGLEVYYPFSDKENIIIEEKNEIEDLVDLLSYNIEMVGLEESQSECISYYISLGLVANRSFLVSGYKSLEIAERIACIYTGNKTSIVDIKYKISEIQEIIDVIENSSSRMLIINGLVENIDYTLISLLPNYAKKYNKSLIITMENKDLVKFFGPDIINNYLLVIPSKYNLSNRNNEYIYADFTNIVDNLRKDQLNKERVDILGKVLDINSFPESYKMSRNIVLNTDYSDTIEVEAKKLVRVLIEAELEELLKLRSRVDILKSIYNKMDLNYSEELMSGEYF